VRLLRARAFGHLVLVDVEWQFRFYVRRWPGNHLSVDLGPIQIDTLKLWRG
jgi:hypothetical protein